MHLLLGYYPVNEHSMPEGLEEPLFTFDTKGFAIVGAIFSLAMTILCVLVSGESLKCD
jgi:hypothetical protein